jgi:hypothetical protein
MSFVAILEPSFVRMLPADQMLSNLQDEEKAGAELQ